MTSCNNSCGCIEAVCHLWPTTCQETFHAPSRACQTHLHVFQISQLRVQLGATRTAAMLDGCMASFMQRCPFACFELRQGEWTACRCQLICPLSFLIPRVAPGLGTGLAAILPGVDCCHSILNGICCCCDCIHCFNCCILLCCTGENMRLITQLPLFCLLIIAVVPRGLALILLA